MITKQDYTKILQFYKMEIPSSNRILRTKAKTILAEKLCRCIKKVDLKNEAKSIGICTKTIFNRKGYHRGKFTCKGKQKVDFRRNDENQKTRKNQRKK